MARPKLFLVGSLLAFAWVLDAQTSSVIVFEHANMIDGISAEPLHDVTVVVHDGKIEYEGVPAHNSPDRAQRIDLDGKCMLPGLIDAHVHPFTLKGAPNMLKAG